MQVNNISLPNLAAQCLKQSWRVRQPAKPCRSKIVNLHTVQHDRHVVGHGAIYRPINARSENFDRVASRRKSPTKTVYCDDWATITGRR